MPRPKRYTARDRGPTYRINHQIRISPIRVIDQDENQLGVIATQDAQRLAREAGLDLVEVAPTARPPVCRILDYGKWRYQQQKKEDKSKSKQSQLKEVKFKTVRIGDHDLGIKVNRAKSFLDEGHKVQFTLQFRGREMAHQELGRELLMKVKTQLADMSKVEQDLRMQGRRMGMVLSPEKKDAKPPKPDYAAEEAAEKKAAEAAAEPADAPKRPAKFKLPPRTGGLVSIKPAEDKPAEPEPEAASA
jgi:translation initiation factor IF-3